MEVLTDLVGAGTVTDDKVRPVALVTVVVTAPLPVVVTVVVSPVVDDVVVTLLITRDDELSEEEDEVDEVDFGAADVSEAIAELRFESVVLPDPVAEKLLRTDVMVTPLYDLNRIYRRNLSKRMRVA